MFDEQLLSSRDVEWCRKQLYNAAQASCAGPEVGQTDSSYPPVELLFEALCLARKQEWTWSCTRETFSILLTVLTFERDEPLCTMAQSFAKFKELLIVKSCERPPWTTGVFSPGQAVELTRFIMTHHYANFRMHKHLMSTQKQVLVIGK
mmetsp:Transcript_2279/g.5253  ORF Transcript_2279/g.5253 Transcript_2279/m.5253 type:complete len:149 (-) Transcript_2279:143-589(-)